MKTTAYIAIFILLYPSFYSVAASSTAARTLVKAAIQPSAQTAPKKTGREWNPKLQHFEIPDESQPAATEENTAGATADTEIKSAFPNSDAENSGNNRSVNLSGSGSSSGSGSPTDNTTKPSGADDPERKLPAKNQGNNSGGGSQGQSFGLWWPVCVFVDGPDANSQITEMVKMSADCQVNLVPYVRTVTVPDPNNPEQLNSLQGQSCNIKEAGIAGKGSSLVLTNRSSTVADKMCGSEETINGVTRPTKNVAGCNQLANGASGKAKTRAESHKGNGDGFGGMAKGEVAVGIVDSEGYKSGAVYSHETMGHGQMGWPNGEKAGNGIGDPNNDKDSSGDHKHGGGYTGIGCAQMRASAIADPEGYHKYYASKTKYYSHRPDQPMPLGEQIWKTYKDGPKINGQIAKNNGSSPRGAESDQSSSGTDLGTAGPGHKKPLGAKNGRNGRRAGEAGASSQRGGTERGDGSGDGSGDGLASQVTGDPNGGSATENSMIVANKDKSLLSKPDPNGEASSVMDPNYFDGDTSNSSGAGGENQSSSLAGATEDRLARNKREISSDMDPDFFKNKSRKTAKRERRTIRRGTADDPSSENRSYKRK